MQKKPGIGSSNGMHSRFYFLRKLRYVLHAVVLQAAVAAAPLSIHPQPQQIDYQSGSLNLSQGIKIVVPTADAPVSQKKQKIDRDALRVLAKAFADSRISLDDTAKTHLLFKATAPNLKKCPGSYQLKIGPEHITLTAHDAAGQFYAAQTLRQIIAASSAEAKQTSLPCLRIHDFPDLTFRGTVEGFYGKPWSHMDRLSQFRFYGQHKMNTYIYGPKDDPYHSSPHWRKPYPAEEAEQIKELVAVARANKVNFYWAVHPGKDIQWNEVDDLALLKKFEAMYALGVRSFAVFFDDISGKGTDPKRQAAILNRIHHEFVLIKKDVTPLVMCPTEYNKGWSNPKPGSYLDILGDQLDPSIHVMWTGNTVVADITHEGMQWVNRRLKRKAFVWWNFPVSDYVRDHLPLGPAYGLETRAANEMSGFTSNPMDKPEASKLALYGVADYCWNSQKYNSQRAWENGIKALMPHAAADAYRMFAQHNSDPGPNYHRYRREESVEIKPAVERFLERYSKDRSLGDSHQRLSLEFTKITSAPKTITSNTNNKALLKEIDPWLRQFEQLGKAGAAALATAEKVHQKDSPSAWLEFLRTDKFIQAMKHNDQTLNQNRWQPGVKTGSLVLTPFVEKLKELNQAYLYADLSGRAIVQAKPFASFSSKGSIEKMTDPDQDSYYESKELQKTGDYVGIDLGAPAPIKEVVILQGKDDNDHDIIHQGILEASIDGKTWFALGGKNSGWQVHYKSAAKPALNARMVRYRVTHAGKLDGSKSDVWTRIRTFQINPGAAQPRISSNHPALKKTPIQIEGNNTSITPLFEVITLAKDQFIGIDFGKPEQLSKVDIDLKVKHPSQRGELQSSMDGKIWKKLESSKSESNLSVTNGVQARHLRFINNTGKNQEIYLHRFAVKTQTSSTLTAGAFNDQNLSTFQKLSDKPIKVSNPERKASHLVLLLSSRKMENLDKKSKAPGHPLSVEVTVIDAHGKAHQLPTVRKQLSVIALDQLAAPIKGCLISSQAKDRLLHEVIWQTAKHP